MDLQILYNNPSRRRKMSHRFKRNPLPVRPISMMEAKEKKKSTKKRLAVGSRMAEDERSEQTIKGTSMAKKRTKKKVAKKATKKVAPKKAVKKSSGKIYYQQLREERKL